MAYDKVVDSAVLDGYFGDIADAIRNKGGEGSFKPQDMAQAIADLPSGGGGSEYEDQMKNWFNRVKTNNRFYYPFPKGATQIPPYLLYWQQTSPVSMSSPVDVSDIPDSVTTIGANAFRASYVYMPHLSSSLVTIGQRAFYETWFRDATGNTTGPIIDIPAGVTQIDKMVFQGATINGLNFLGDVTRIESSGLYLSSNNKRTLKFTHNTQVPTLASTLWSTRNDDVIVVPDALYNDWIAATNWSAVAARIVKASDYTG